MVEPAETGYYRRWDSLEGHIRSAQVLNTIRQQAGGPPMRLCIDDDYPCPAEDVYAVIDRFANGHAAEWRAEYARESHGEAVPAHRAFAFLYAHLFPKENGK